MYWVLCWVLGCSWKPAWCGWPWKDSKRHTSLYKQKILRGWKMCFEKQWQKVGGKKYCVCGVLGSFEEMAWEPGRRCGGWGRGFTSGGLGPAPASRTHQLGASLGGGGQAQSSLWHLSAWRLAGLAFIPHQILGGSDEVIYLRMLYKGMKLLFDCSSKRSVVFIEHILDESTLMDRRRLCPRV